MREILRHINQRRTELCGMMGVYEPQCLMYNGNCWYGSGLQHYRSGGRCSHATPSKLAVIPGYQRCERSQGSQDYKRLLNGLPPTPPFKVQAFPPVTEDRRRWVLRASMPLKLPWREVLFQSRQTALTVHSWEPPAKEAPEVACLNGGSEQADPVGEAWLC